MHEIATCLHRSFVLALLLLSPLLVLASPANALEPAVGPGARPAANAAEHSQPPAPTFEVWEFEVAGNTLIDRQRIERVLTPFLGPGKTAESIQKAADALETLYRDSGYATSYVEIPEQNVTSGVVQLKVTEGRISRVRISGADYFRPSTIREQLINVKAGQPLYVPGVQEDINSINSYASDLRVVPVLKPGRYPGDVELDIKVDDKRPLHGSVGLSNYHTASTTPTRLDLNIGYYNLWQMGHSISLQAQTSPENTQEVRVYGFTYLLPAFDRDRIALYAMKSESEIAALSDVTVIGNGTIIGARYVVSLASSASIVHSLSLGVDDKNFKEALHLVGSDTYKTPIHYDVWSILYSSNFLNKQSTTNFGVEYAFGIKGVGNDDKEFGGGVDPNTGKRYGSRPNFSHLQLKFKRVDFFDDWQLHSKLILHLADSPLISNEQYSAGGATSVRGYNDSEALGDNAIVWGLEGVTPMWLKPRDWLQNLKFSLFAEGANLEVLQPLPDQDNKFDLLSAGVGLRLEFWKDLTLQVDCGYPFVGTSNVDAGDVMTHAQLNWEF